ncbi:MAG: hypothetical protein JST01_28980 [Cyanobacteria bacterium SZAS TMP-1]|nr:hypothetical protein [Cyanobacteria bacterium SZAS TMP-1]
MSISNNTPEELSTPHEFAGNEPVENTGMPISEGFAAQQMASITANEEPFVSSEASKSWGISGIVMATLFFIAILVVGSVAERSLSRLAPNKPAPTTGVVIEQAATTPTATPAYPTVYVQQSADPSQAPSPLPPTPPAR